MQIDTGKFQTQLLLHRDLQDDEHKVTDQAQ